MSLNTTPRTWVIAEVVSAAEMNTEIRDAITGLQASWTSYTPSWTATGTAPAIGNGQLLGKWQQIGKSIDVQINVIPGSTTTFGTGSYSFSVPVASDSTPAITAIGGAYLLGTDHWIGVTVISPGASAITIQLPISTTNPRTTAMTNTSPETFANASQLRLTVRYEAA